MMPINLLDYSPNKRRFLKNRGDHCVYVIAPAPEGPCKIGYAIDVAARFSTIQSGNWNALYAFAVFWTPGKPVALNVEIDAHLELKKRGLWRSGEWFDVSVAEAERLIQDVSGKRYPTITLHGHGAMIEQLRRRGLDKKDWIEKSA